MVQTNKRLKIFMRPMRWVGQRFAAYWRSNWWHKLVTVGVVVATVTLTGMYSVALWYQHEQAGKPMTLGVTFIADYAAYLGLDAHQTYNAILHELHPKHIRLVSYWSDIEPAQGQYDFSELDYEMQQAQTSGAKVSLSIGLRQPRWPECHAPTWVDTAKPESAWEPQLEAYMTTVINRYKHNPVLESYQLENEYYLNAFGQCQNFDRNRLERELALVHQLDPGRAIIMSRSNNYAGLSLRQPLPDVVGISIYRHVWPTQLHRYLTYPFPSWYYAFLAGAEQILTGKPSVVHELQAEPWPPHGQDILHTSLAEQNKTFNASTLKSTVTFGEQTGIKNIDLWGVEYWYYRSHVLHDPSVWNAAERIFNS
ncbi:MAG TPA: beta-galactosidase [Candidatus Saccharimonadales bacterium]|nr:beta-galactosidase [Candidatus Saccharimonadales bacterium]